VIAESAIYLHAKSARRLQESTIDKPCSAFQTAPEEKKTKKH
jgi:hypothetical protein